MTAHNFSLSLYAVSVLTSQQRALIKEANKEANFRVYSE